VVAGLEAEEGVVKDWAVQAAAGRGWAAQGAAEMVRAASAGWGLEAEEQAAPAAAGWGWAAQAGSEQEAKGGAEAGMEAEGWAAPEAAGWDWGSVAAMAGWAALGWAALEAAEEPGAAASGGCRRQNVLLLAGVQPGPPKQQWRRCCHSVSHRACRGARRSCQPRSHSSPATEESQPGWSDSPLAP